MRHILDRFKTELGIAIRSHHKRLTTTIPDIYGYALFTDDGLSSVGSVANPESAIPVDPSDKMYGYYRYLAVEWSEWDDFGLFDTVNQIIKEIHADESIEFSVKRKSLLRAGLAALCELEADGVFGRRTSGRFVVICVCDSDEPIMMESARLLNTADVFAAYASQF